MIVLVKIATWHYLKKWLPGYFVVIITLVFILLVASKSIIHFISFLYSDKNFSRGTLIFLPLFLTLTTIALEVS